MKTLMAIRLAIVWIILFVLPLTCANFTDVCNETYSNTKGLQCFPCSPGYTKKDDCRTNQTLAQCTQCNEGTYQPHCISANETGECRNCTLCAVYIKHCTIYKNSVCGRRNSTEDTSEEKGYGRLIVCFSILVVFLTVLFIGICFNCRHRKLIKPATNNKRNSDESTDLKMLRGDTNHGVRRKGEYIRTYTATESEASRLLESIESTEGEISRIKCLFGENDKKLEISKEKTVKLHVDGSSKDTCITDESQVIKTKDVLEEKNRKLSKESKPIAVIPPVKGAGVKYSDLGNRYGGLQLTRERLQFSGDSENTPEESTNNKEPANKGTPLSPAENQAFNAKDPAESDEKGCKQNGYTHQIENEQVQTERLQSSPEKEREERRQVNQDDNQLSLVRYQDKDDKDNENHAYMIDWDEVSLRLYKILPPAQWFFFGIELLHTCQQYKTLNAHNTVTEIERDARNRHTEGWVQAVYLMVFKKWKAIMGSRASFRQIEDAIEKTIDDRSVMDTFMSIKRNPPYLKMHHEKDLRAATMIPEGCTPGISDVFPIVKQLSQPCFALHELETQSRGHSSQYNSSSHSQVSSIVLQQCNPPMHVSDTPRSQAVSTHHAVQCSLRYETSINDILRDQDSKERQQCSCSTVNKKRKLLEMTEEIKQTTNLIEQMRRYQIENAKQNLLADNIPIRQIDYDVFMEYVIDRVMKVCNVSKRVVLSITSQSFREIQEITTPRNETVYLLYSGIPYLNLTKEVYEDIKLYAMNVRTKLLDHLGANDITYNKEDVDVFLFITFTGTSVLDEDSKTKRKKIRKKTNTYSSLDHAQEPDSDPADTLVSVQNIGTEEAILQSESDITITDNEKNRKGVNISHIHGSTKQDEVDIGNSAVRRGVIHNENAPQNADENQNLSLHVPTHFENETENNLTDPQHRVPRAEGNAFKQDQEQDSKASVSQSQTAIDRSEAAVDEINFQDKKIPQNEVILIESDDEMAMIRDSFFPTGNETYTLEHNTTLKSEIPDILKKIQTQDGDDKQLDIKT